MDNRKNKNLDELLARFYGKDAKEVAEDIAEGERILRNYPAPTPDDETMILLKAKVAKAVAANKERSLRRTNYRMVAFAAAIIVVAFTGVALLVSRPVGQKQAATTVKVTKAVSQNYEFFYDDEEMATLNAEVKRVGDEVAELETGIASEDLDISWMDIEMRLIDIESNFWKG